MSQPARNLPSTQPLERLYALRSAGMNPIIRKPEQCLITGLSLSTLYRMQKSGEYPQSVALTKGISGIYLSDLLDWLENRETWKTKRSKD